MSNSLKTLKERITSKHLLQNHYFKVTFDPISNVAESGSFFTGSFDIFCQGATLPGKSLNSLDVKRHNITLKMPDHVTWDGTWTPEVLVDLSMDGYKTLQDWMNYYSNVAVSGAGARGFPPTNATVTILDNNFQETEHKMKIFGIFPTKIPDISFAHTSSSYVTQQITFTYSYTSPLGDISDPLG